jgi:hypothetical protein
VREVVCVIFYVWMDGWMCGLDIESVASGWLIGTLSPENGFQKGDRVSLLVVPLLRTFGC